MPCPENVVDADDILVVETEQDLDFSQRALAVRLVLKWADFLDGNALVCHVIQSGAGGTEQFSYYTLHDSCTIMGREIRLVLSSVQGRCRPLECTCDNSFSTEMW